MSEFNNTCRCDGVRMEGSDHCPQCGCEEFEERCEWDVPFENRPKETETDTSLDW